MPALRTDDGPRKLRAVWLGPKGATLPFEWTYVQWSVTLLAAPAAAVLLFTLTHLIGAPGWVQVLAGLYGAVAGVYLAVKAMRNVTFDEPLRHKTATVRAEFSRTRQAAEQATSWVWPVLPLTDLTQVTASLFIPIEGVVRDAEERAQRDWESETPLDLREPIKSVIRGAEERAQDEWNHEHASSDPTPRKAS